MERNPIEAAEILIEEIRASKTQKERAAFAILHQGEAVAVMENLISFHRGYADGTAADTLRLAKVASALLSEIAKLQDALHARKRLGLPENTQEQFTRDWVNGSAPKLWALAEQLREILKR